MFGRTCFEEGVELERIDERLFVYGIRGDVVHLHVASRAGSVYSEGWKLVDGSCCTRDYRDVCVVTVTC